MINEINFTNLSLREASGNGHLEVVKLLLENEDTDFKKALIEEAGLALLDASANGHHEVVKLLLEQEDADCKESLIKTAGSALSEASGNGHHEVVKLLLEQEDENFKKALIKEAGWSLLIASANGHLEVMYVIASFCFRENIKLPESAVKNEKFNNYVDSILSENADWASFVPPNSSLRATILTGMKLDGESKKIAEKISGMITQYTSKLQFGPLHATISRGMVVNGGHKEITAIITQYTNSIPYVEKEVAEDIKKHRDTVIASQNET